MLSREIVQNNAVNAIIKHSYTGIVFVSPRVGKSGDDSPHDSVPGRSGTGAGDPGHVHIQIYKPGSGIPSQSFQYSQERQANFVKQNLVPLFGR